MIMQLHLPVYIHVVSTRIIQVTWINLRGGEYNTGISDDGGRVGINTVTSTMKETTNRGIKLGTSIPTVTSSEATRPNLKRTEPFMRV